MREGLEHPAALKEVRRAWAAHPGDRGREPHLRAERSQHGAPGRGPEGARGTLAQGEGAAVRAVAPPRQRRIATGRVPYSPECVEEEFSEVRCSYAPVFS